MPKGRADARALVLRMLRHDDALRLSDAVQAQYAAAGD